MDSNALAFLRAVLPEHGWYAAWTKLGPKRSYNRFFATVEELAAHIALEDAQGKTVYHACSTFVEPGKRTQQKVWGARSLWLDIDAGKPDSPYATPVDAAEAVLRFASSVSLPRPTLVGSGTGIHAYWPLSESLAGDDWLDLALGLKHLCDVQRLRDDPSRTADLASVLRTPGTHNRKLETVRLVEAGLLEGPYDVDLFDHLLEYGGAVARVDRDPVRAVADHRDSRLTLAQALIVEPEYAPVHADEIANQCAQLALLRDRQGNTPEPHWYACLGVLSRCVDGEEKAHAWSSGHPQYSEEETQAKLERTLALTGATTCAKFEGVNAAGCNGCVLRGLVVSPISAGRSADFIVRQQPIQSSTSTTTTSAGLETPAQLGSSAAALSMLPPLPDNFAWRWLSLVFVTENKNGQPTDAIISQYPIYLVGIGTGEVRGDHFGFHFRQWLPHRGDFDLHVGAGKLFGSAGASELAERGAVIHDHKLFLNYVRAAADIYHATEKLKMHFDQCGWKEDFASFLVGNALYTPEGVQEGVTVSSELSTRAQWLGPQSGTLEGWSSAANALFAAGCEAQSFALACAFAAVLMRFQAGDEGGAVVNLLSRTSGTGKTTALAGVSSAWGVKQGLSLTNIDTRVSKAITLGVLGNLPVIYDELGNRDPQVIRELITMFTNGRDKMRGEQDGTIRHTQANWQTLMVTGSNISIHDLLAHTGGSDALAFRVLEFQCKLPESVAPARGDRLRLAMEKNAGWAGDAFIDYLLQPGVLPWARQALEKWTQELWDKTGGRPEHRFWMRTLGCVAVASTLVNQAEILSFQPSRIVDWALDQLNLGFHAHRKPEEKRDTTRDSVETLGEFLGTHVDTVLVVRKAFQQGQRTKDMPLTRPPRNVFMRYELEGQRLMISERALRAWLLKQEVGTRELLDDLVSIGLVSNRRRYATLTAGTDIVGSQQAVVEINAEHPAVSGALSVVAPAVVQDNDVASVTSC